MCVNFCLQFVSFKFHAVSITRRFQYMPFPVSSYPPFPIHAVSSPLELHPVSFTRAFHHYHCYTSIPLHTVSVTRAFSVPFRILSWRLCKWVEYSPKYPEGMKSFGQGQPVNPGLPGKWPLECVCTILESRGYSTVKTP